ncbi:MAG: SBBP repeat-containing protein [Aureliella sp.]
MILDGNAIDADPTSLATNELVFASYLGGSGDENTTYLGLALSPSGDLLIGGATNSTDFPTTSQPSVDSTHGGGIDGIVASFRPTTGGYEQHLTTYLGGSSTDYIRGIGVDDSGLIHVAGNTNSEVFPLTPDAFQTERDGRVGFVTRMSSDGEIQYSTFFGNETVQDAKIDAGGNTYIVGTSAVEGFPVTPGAYTPPTVSGSIGTYVSKIDATGALELSTWFQPSLGRTNAGFARIELDGDRPLILGVDTGGGSQNKLLHTV